MVKLYMSEARLRGSEMNYRSGQAADKQLLRCPMSFHFCGSVCFFSTILLKNTYQNLTVIIKLSLSICLCGLLGTCIQDVPWYDFWPRPQAVSLAPPNSPAQLSSPSCPRNFVKFPKLPKSIYCFWDGTATDAESSYSISIWNQNVFTPYLIPLLLN